ncbi:MAG: HAD family hydrolase [Chloroflexi bacterium]|nr:MAG: HAD family hydrolase [Chloroflexota bacterium]
MQRRTKVVSFDMNGTLTRDRYAELVWGEGIPSLYSRLNGVSLDEAKEYVFGEYDRVGEGRVEWYDIRYWFDYFGLGDGWRELLEGFRREAGPFPDAIEALEKLTEGYQLIVTSNATREFIDVELGAAGLKGYFTRVFSSTSDFGMVKKTPDVYLEVCRALGVQPEEMVHVGDHRYFDFVVPGQLGIRAFYLDRRGVETGESVVRDLADFCRRV